MCQLDWVADAQIVGRTLFLDVSMKVFPEENSLWMGRLSKEDWPHQCQVGVISLGEDLMRTKRQRKGKFAALLELRAIFSCPSPTPESQAFRPESGLRPLAPPGSQAFEFVLDLPTSFPGPPACRPQIMRLLSVHNHVNFYNKPATCSFTHILLVLFL